MRERSSDWALDKKAWAETGGGKEQTGGRMRGSSFLIWRSWGSWLQEKPEAGLAAEERAG